MQTGVFIKNLYTVHAVTLPAVWDCRARKKQEEDRENKLN